MIDAPAGGTSPRPNAAAHRSKESAVVVLACHHFPSVCIILLLYLKSRSSKVLIGNHSDRCADVGRTAMLIKKARIQGFDDWVDVFHQWREDIGYPTELIGKDYQFETKLGELESDEIEF